MTRFVLALTVAIAGLGALTAGAPDAHAQRYYRPYRTHYYQPYRAHYHPHSRVHVAIYPKGLYFGGGVVGTRILNQRGGSEILGDGGGLNLYTGFRVNRTLALEAGWIGTLHNPERVRTVFGDDTEYLVMAGFTADAKIFLPTSTPYVEPFVQGGVGLYLLDRESFGTQSVGTGFQAGGGVQWKVGHHVNLGVRALYRGLAMGPPDRAATDTFVSALSLDGNLTFEF